ncbi:pentatricopeptide repeat-containing protein At2g42920, chloroplastic [Gastrolobium bilobum]|uniref:pentatricopeptide repeat-containing protein At2g42920, chloroplastic n=1 Tax=Gastrolobium bilobum TaxID=150636 RepID=UPI002AAF0C44|nr:pentatricopeptide repeat-containing protein At2g42920, chloroplastic [Gastrolobium bilobum]
MSCSHQGPQAMSTLCSSLSPSTPPSISKFISDHPCLTMLQKHCTTMTDFQKIYAHIIKTGLALDPIAASRVLTFCASSSGNINYAYVVFTRMPNPNLYSWNTIIRGFSRSSTPQFAISLFVDMLYSAVEPQRLTYPSVFKAYAQLGAGHDGTQLHGRVVKLGLERDHFIRNTIIYMYANSGLLSEARRVFDEHMELDVVACNSVIMGLAKCGEIDESRRLFDNMPTRTAITWNSMISGYVRNGRLMQALELFRKMQEEGVEPSEFTMVSLLNACAHLGALQHGEWVHDYIKRNHFELNVIVLTAIIDMYCKCGSIENAIEVFEASPTRGLSCWNSIIIGLAMNGHEREAIEFFSKLESSKLKPDRVSFIGVLTACKHLAAIDKARDYFASMMNKYEIEPSIKHYTCMVEVLGQAALLEEAEELIKGMPIQPDAIIWGSLLSSCRKQGNVQIAKRAAQRVCELNPSDASGYVLMSNVQAASNQFEEAMEHRLLMKESLTEKEPGCSSIELYGEVHEFLAGGRLHPKTREIYSLLNDSSFALKD